ncbi:MAG: Plug domain-containing protein, partial [Kordiimonadaceae bacterium]|nr:Plug domain-containing protein [Kordiimonadaceae bacterium]
MPLNVLAAQDAPENTSVVTYGEDYFKKYSPLTLIDILERIPGVPAILGQGNGQRQQERGFGSSGDQILINGKRLSAKGNSIRDLLSRTPAGDVERVELIRGAADGLEVQSEGL